MINRDTCPMLPVIENDREVPTVIGVIGIEQGVGATFICDLLERELKNGRYDNEGRCTQRFKIVDLGESRKEVARTVTDKLIIVVDGRSPSEEKLEGVLKIMKDHRQELAVVFNKCSDDPRIRNEFLRNEEGVLFFKIPLIPVEKFTELYNFIFYSG